VFLICLTLKRAATLRGATGATAAGVTRSGLALAPGSASFSFVEEWHLNFARDWSATDSGGHEFQMGNVSCRNLRQLLIRRMHNLDLFRLPFPRNGKANHRVARKTLLDELGFQDERRREKFRQRLPLKLLWCDETHISERQSRRIRGAGGNRERGDREEYRGQFHGVGSGGSFF